MTIKIRDRFGRFKRETRFNLSWLWVGFIIGVVILAIALRCG